MYLIIKHTHITLVLLSIAGFIIRAIWMLRGSQLSDHRLTRILPHVLDTLLLASGVALMFVIHQYPIANAWLTSKMAGLVAYIVLGAIALKRGRTMTVRCIALAAALVVVAWMISVARLHAPLGFLQVLFN